METTTTAPLTDFTETTAVLDLPHATMAPVETKRGPGRPRTKMTLKRVVLLDGQPVGRGRPSKTGKGNRTCVFIPVDETYDVMVHGAGKKYSAGLVQYRVPIKRVDLSKWHKLVAAR